MSYSHNYIVVYFLDNNITSWRLSCFYGFPESTRHKSSLDSIRLSTSRSQLLWCIFGDFNDLLYPADKMGNIPHPPSLWEGFQKVIDDSLLNEVDLTGGKFT